MNTAKRKINIVLEAAIVGTGDQCKAYAQIEPADEADTGIMWFSSNSDIASVDKDGTIIARSEGRVALVAEAADGSGEYGVSWLRVMDHPFQPEKYTVTFESGYENGDSFQIIATEGLPIQVPGCLFQPPGESRFLYWDMDGLSLVEGDNVDIYSDISIKAVWESA